MDESDTTDAQFIEAIVCKESEISTNALKLVNLDQHKILLTKQGNKIFAFGQVCPHHGGLLSDGVLGRGRIRCPMHGACFSIETGDIEDFPSLDKLPCFDVKCHNGYVSVKAEVQSLRNGKAVKSYTKLDRENKSVFIVAGGGPAGMTCVESLRSFAYSGKIIFVLGEPYLPYNRMKLLKYFLSPEENIQFRDEQFYKTLSIDVKYNNPITNIKPLSKSIILKNGEILKFDKMFLATGATARKPAIPGADLNNIFVMRTMEDALKIRQSINETTDLIVLGTSFIGMEITEILASKVKKVTVIGKQQVPFDFFGQIIGEAILKIYKEKGVHFILENEVIEFLGDGNISSVKLKDGQHIKADVCIIGIGVKANTDYLETAGVQLLPDKTIEVDSYLRTSMEDVLAGGAMVTAPLMGFKVNTGHFAVAQTHGHVAALNMIGKATAIKPIPFIWTKFFGYSLRCSGHASTYTYVKIVGDVNKFRFVAFYVEKEIVKAVMSTGNNAAAAKFAELLHADGLLLAGEVDKWIRDVSPF